MPPAASQPSSTPAYRRILLKLSGEALMGTGDYGIDPAVIGRVAGEIRELLTMGVQVAVVIGGGNIFRGAGLAAGGLDRVTADQMGMLATIMNALAMQDAMERLGVEVRVMSAIKMHQVCEDYAVRRALRHLEQGRLVILAAGTGNPFFTTDSAASLRGIELHAQLVIKATKVDGVYSADPIKHPDAIYYPRLTYDQVLERKLMVMDVAAMTLCRDYKLPLRVFNMNKAGALKRVVMGEDEGTLVTC